MYKFIMHYLLVCMNEQIHVYTHALHPVGLITARHALELEFEFLTGLGLGTTHRNPLSAHIRFSRNWPSQRAFGGNEVRPVAINRPADAVVFN